MSWRLALRPIPDIFDWYKDNGAAGTLLLAVFLVVKGYVLAKGDLSTALGILQYAGLVSVVIAGLLSSLPILAAAMLAYTVHRAIRPLRAPAGKLVAVLLGATALSAVFTPWTFMAGAIVTGLLIGLQRGIFDQLPDSWLAWGIKLTVGLVVDLAIGLGAVYAVIAMLYTVWLPHEIVAFTTGPGKNQPPGQQVGYVLAEGDGWITILTSGQHRIVRYKDSAVKSFTLCERSPHGGWSDISDATTLWQEITKPSALRSVHAVANKVCPPAGQVALFS